MIYSFASCRLDDDRHVFERAGEALHLEPQVFDLIGVLAAAAGAMVSREELIERVWAGLNVSDATISARINAARKAVGDDGKAQTVIETVARRGFRMKAAVRCEGGVAAVAVARADIPTLAVLPFDDLAPDPDGMLADGIVDEITGALSRVHEFRVIARQSSYSLPKRSDLRQAATALGASYLVTGTVRRSGERVRISVDLADANGVSLWSARFDDRLDDLFALQDRIAMQVAGQLPVNLRTAEIARARAAPGPRRARDLVLRAMPLFWAHRREANAEAVAVLSEALEIDPENVPAMAYKAWALAQQPSYLWSDDPAGDHAEALRLARRAAERVGDDPGALAAISAAYCMAEPELTPAPVSFARRAIEIDPNSAWGHMRMGWALIAAKQRPQAVPFFERAQRLSPLDPFMFNMKFGMAAAWMGMGRFGEAAALVSQTLAENPSVSWAYRLLAVLHVGSGDLDNARKALFRLLEAHPDLTIRKVIQSAPPTMVVDDLDYLGALRAAGLPEG